MPFPRTRNRAGTGSTSERAAKPAAGRRDSPPAIDGEHGRAGGATLRSRSVATLITLLDRNNSRTISVLVAHRSHSVNSSSSSSSSSRRRAHGGVGCRAEVEGVPVVVVAQAIVGRGAAVCEPHHPHPRRTWLMLPPPRASTQLSCFACWHACAGQRGCEASTR
jgi:hypothetical protein